MAPIDPIYKRLNVMLFWWSNIVLLINIFRVLWVTRLINTYIFRVVWVTCLMNIYLVVWVTCLMNIYRVVWVTCLMNIYSVVWVTRLMSLSNKPDKYISCGLSNTMKLISKILSSCIKLSIVQCQMEQLYLDNA